MSAFLFHMRCNKSNWWSSSNHMTLIRPVFSKIYRAFKHRNSNYGTENLPLNSDHHHGSVLPLTKVILDTIKVSGPINVSQYMKYALYHPQYGYYFNGHHDKSFVSVKGDFITTPEVSQFLGEMIGIYLTYYIQLVSTYGTQRFSLVELGAGNGTLLTDILRTFSQFPSVFNRFSSIQLIEICPSLRAIQKEALHKCITNLPGFHRQIQFHDSLENDKSNETSNQDFKIIWHDSLDTLSVKDSPLMIAHEFLDALPIHQFKLSKAGTWEEIVISSTTSDQSNCFELSLSKDSNFSHLMDYFENPRDFNLHENIIQEISLDSIHICQQMMEKLGAFGTILIIDYGYYSNFKSSLRGIRNHTWTDAFSHPGLTDISADVNFNMISSLFSKRDHPIIGPFYQRTFLSKLGLETRYQSLLQRVQYEEEKLYLKKSMQRLKEIEEIYKTLVVLPRDLNRNIVESLVSLFK